MSLVLTKTGHKHQPSDIKYIDKDMKNNTSGQSVDICMTCGEVVRIREVPERPQSNKEGETL